MSMPFYVPPEQLVKDRAEYARKGIARGRSIVAIEYVDGLLLLAENPSRTLYKISEIYDRIAFAGVGKYNEFEALRVAGIRHADLKGYLYGRPDVAAKGLANAFSQTLGNIFTHEIKPYEVEVLVTEVGANDEDNRLFKVTYDGTLYEEHRLLRHRWSGGNLDGVLGGTVRGAAPLFRPLFKWWQPPSLEVEQREIDGWEAAVLDSNRERRTFHRLSQEEIAEALG